MTTRSHHTGLAVIAVFKVVKGLLLLLLGLGLLKLMHAEIATLFSLLIEALHLNADSRLIHALVLKVDALQAKVPQAEGCGCCGGLAAAFVRSTFVA